MLLMMIISTIASLVLGIVLINMMIKDGTSEGYIILGVTAGFFLIYGFLGGLLGIIARSILI